MEINFFPIGNEFLDSFEDVLLKNAQQFHCVLGVAGTNDKRRAVAVDVYRPRIDCAFGVVGLCAEIKTGAASSIACSDRACRAHIPG